MFPPNGESKMKKCVMCHEHYADVKKGEPIGTISYTVPIQ